MSSHEGVRPIVRLLIFIFYASAYPNGINPTASVRTYFFKEDKMEKTNSFLETEPTGRLMKKYALPCIISLIVAALYNVVDQLFIANAD